VRAVETAGARLGVQLVMVPVRTVEDFEGAFSTMSREQVGGFLVVSERSPFRTARASQTSH
jgi:hypothetical protein